MCEIEEDSSGLDPLTGIESTQVALPSTWANHSVHIRSSLSPLPGCFAHPPTAVISDGSKKTSSSVTLLSVITSPIVN